MVATTRPQITTPPVQTAPQPAPGAQNASMIAAQTISIQANDLLRRYINRPVDGIDLFYVILYQNRMMLIYDLTQLNMFNLPDAYVRSLRQILEGRKMVYRPNTRGTSVVMVISYQPKPVQQVAEPQLVSVPLDLTKQPTPYHLPIGMTRTGPLWLSLLEMDSVLIGGARRMGKTHEIHSWIQAAQYGNAMDIHLWDGKGNTEFGRYAGHGLTKIIKSISETLNQIELEVARRQEIFARVGVTNLPDYLKLSAQPATLRPIMLVLDELADLSEEDADTLAGLVRRAGAYGVHPVVGIQRPDAEVLKGQLRANLVTRIALPTVSPEDSRIILQRTGADRLPKTKGRLLLVWDGRLIEAQGFIVTTPISVGKAVPALPVISERERKLVEAAGEARGYFRVREIAEATGDSRDWVNETARRWEAQGLLTTTQHDTLGRRLGRRITPVLAQACGFEAGFGGLADLADQADLPGQAPDLAVSDPD